MSVIQSRSYELWERLINTEGVEFAGSFSYQERIFRFGDVYVRLIDYEQRVEISENINDLR